MGIEENLNILVLEETDSTNLYAKNNIENLKDKTIIQALRQTSGRGRLSRKWVDFGYGNVFLTLVLKPAKTFDEKYSNLTQYLSVVLAKLLESYGVKTQIKWPNDVLVNGKKIAGILAETVMRANNFKGLVLGVGVNLNATISEVESIKDKAVTSLNLETGKDIDMNLFVKQLASLFFENYNRFMDMGFEFIKPDYLSRFTYIGKEITINVLNEQKQGRVKSITDKGELVLETQNKEIVLTIGDIL